MFSRDLVHIAHAADCAKGEPVKFLSKTLEVLCSGGVAPEPVADRYPLYPSEKTSIIR